MRLRALAALGLGNVARVAWYRAALRAGLHPAQRLRADIPPGPFFRPRSSAPPKDAAVRTEWGDTGPWFGRPLPSAMPPDWHRNPFTGARADPTLPWHAIGDFDPALGDIKGIWEVSRFDWLLAMAQRAALGNGAELDRLNQWLADWVAANPPYRGVNWKCGQEAAIRLLHCAASALVLDQVDDPEPALLALVAAHCGRIAPTMGYAIAQQNNHATSEAAALFVGGSWLERAGRRAARFAATGRRELDRQAARLIAPDGSFSQYSLVYHALMLDSYCLAESWRRRLDLPPFADRTYARLAAATDWLARLVDPASGDAPNLGANDGSRILAFADDARRDFRPTLQWASVLFRGARAFAATGPWDQPLAWLDIASPPAVAPDPTSATLGDGGLHVLRIGQARAYLRYPAFRFRPSQADALHCDLWVGGLNLLRDTGTGSYAWPDSRRRQFAGAPGHNLIEFDGRDQMPAIGRFLYGHWLKAGAVDPVQVRDDGVEAAAAYRDWRGNSHHRRIRLERHELRCEDRIEGPASRAVLRWHLAPGDWRVEGQAVVGPLARLDFSGDHDCIPVLTTGAESILYGEDRSVPLVLVHLPVPARVVTRVRFG